MTIGELRALTAGLPDHAPVLVEVAILQESGDLDCDEVDAAAELALNHGGSVVIREAA